MTPDEIAIVDTGELDSMPRGEGLQKADVTLLVVLGIVIPAVLLIWGWL